MKRLITFLLLMLSIVLTGYAQERETVRPLVDTEVVRKVTEIDIEGEIFNNVVVTMKSTTPDYLITDKYKVKVSVKDENGKTIWKKTLKNAFLYVFSNGQVQVGKPNFDQILIQKSSATGKTLGMIREKEGIY